MKRIFTVTISLLAFAPGYVQAQVGAGIGVGATVASPSQNATGSTELNAKGTSSGLAPTPSVDTVGETTTTLTPKTPKVTVESTVRGNLGDRTELAHDRNKAAQEQREERQKQRDAARDAKNANP